MHTTRVTFASAVLAVVLAGVARGQTTVALRPTAEVAAGAPITLADAADITGPDAGTLGAVVLAPAAGRRSDAATEIDVARVRALLAATAGVNLGRVSLAGSRCRVRSPLAAPTVEATPSTMPTRAEPADDETDTVRCRIIERIAADLGVPAQDVRLTFDARDERILGTHVGGKRALIQPTGAGDRVPISVRLYDHDRITDEGAVRVGVLVRRDVLIAKAPIARADTVGAGDVTRDERWMPPSASCATGDRAFGMSARKRIAAGEVVRLDDVQPPLVAKAGDLLSVDVMSGGFCVRRMMRASEPGRDGETIKVQTLEGKRTLRARLNGAGRAVVVLEGGGGRGRRASRTRVDARGSDDDDTTDDETTGEETAMTTGRNGRIQARSLVAAGGVLGLLLTSGANGQAVMRQPPPAPIDQAGRSDAQAPLKGVSLMLVEAPKPKTINIHDKITIIINETSKQTSDQKLDTKKDDSLQATLKQFPDLMQLLTEARLEPGARKPLTGVDVSTTGKFKGDGQYERNDKFSDKVTASVLDVRPNGVLVLEARRTIKKDKEEQTIVLSGECRREDVTNNNTVLSTQLSDLVIEVQNKGQVKDAASKGVLTRLFETIFNF